MKQHARTPWGKFVKQKPLEDYKRITTKTYNAYMKRANIEKLKYKQWEKSRNAYQKTFGDTDGFVSYDEWRSHKGAKPNYIQRRKDAEYKAKKTKWKLDVLQSKERAKERKSSTSAPKVDPVTDFVEDIVSEQLGIEGQTEAESLWSWLEVQSTVEEQIDAEQQEALAAEEQWSSTPSITSADEQEEFEKLFGEVLQDQYYETAPAWDYDDLMNTLQDPDFRHQVYMDYKNGGMVDKEAIYDRINAMTYDTADAVLQMQDQGYAKLTGKQFMDYLHETGKFSSRALQTLERNIKGAYKGA